MLTDISRLQEKVGVANCIFSSTIKARETLTADLEDEAGDETSIADHRQRLRERFEAELLVASSFAFP